MVVPLVLPEAPVADPDGAAPTDVLDEPAVAVRGVEPTPEPPHPDRTVTRLTPAHTITGILNRFLVAFTMSPPHGLGVPRHWD